jgi:iron-sulfur cluster repair protein YtfE (RIC family)
MTNAEHVVIDPTMSVGEIIRRYPKTSRLLVERGIDICCEGGLQLTTAADDAGLDLATLLQDMATAAANDTRATVPSCSVHGAR